MPSDSPQTAQEFAQAKLKEWFGDDWVPLGAEVPSQGYHGTRKDRASEIIEQGFKVPETKADGTNKRRAAGHGVYFFVETSRSLATGMDGHKAASHYATHQRRWNDAMIIVAEFRLGWVLDMDAWTFWHELLKKVSEAVDHEIPPGEERRAGHENNILAALTLLEHALGWQVEAVLFWADKLPSPGLSGYHCLVVRPPHEGRLLNLKEGYPRL